MIKNKLETRILEIIYEAIDELNLSSDTNIPKKEDSELYSASGELDSLDLVNLVVSIEQRIEDEFDKPVSLADEKAFSQKRSPFSNVKLLKSYILSLLS